MRNSLKLAGVSLCALGLSLGMTPALAEDQQVQPSGGQSAEKADDYAGNDIIVTAQFREQSVQKTPIAISAFDADLLDRKGVSDISGAANLAPNVQLSAGAGNFGGMAAIFIRGVGQSDPHFALEPGVGMYIDDIYYGVLTGSIFELMDVDRVEVLRGPQGTLSGKNSIGGAVKLFSTRPGPNADAFVEAGYGSRNIMLARAATNVTLADGLYARISVGTKRSDGYVSRLDYACATKAPTGGTSRVGIDCKIGEQGGQNVVSGRVALRWEPSSRVNDTLIADVTHDRSQNPATRLLVSSPAWTGGANYMTPQKDYTNYEDYVSLPRGGSSAGVRYSLSSITPVDSWGISNNLSIDLTDNLKLSSITAYRSSDTTFNSTLDSSPASILDQVWQLDHEQFTQELRLNGQISSLLDWTAGGYYYKANGTSGGRVTINGGLQLGGGGLNLDILFRDPVETESKSLFLHTVWHPLDGFNVTAAVRYTDDRKSFTFNRYDLNGAPHPTLGSLTNYTGVYSGDRFDYRLGIDYQWTPSLMTYAQVSTGYKGGGVNPRPFVSTQVVPYKPETLTSYELGFKSRLVGRRLTLNGAIFLSDYKDFQATLLRCDSLSPAPGFPCTQSTNVGDARIKGAELEIFAEPVDGFTIDGSVGYLDFKYKSVVPATGITLSMTNVYTPEWTAATGVQYAFNLSKAGSLTPRFDMSYRSRVEGDSVNQPISSLPGRAIFGASLKWKSADDDWEAQLSIQNLADKYYLNSTGARPNAPYFTAVGVVAPPRTVLFTVKRKFD
jgi:iron complex outermembrane receptor protein